MAISLVSVDMTGHCQLLAPGNPITVANGANSTTYPWNQVYAMTDTQLNALNIYRIDNSLQIPAGMTLNSVTYSYANGAVTVNPVYSATPSANVTPSFTTYQADVMNAVSNYIAAITAQVAPSSTHMTAYQNALAILGPSITLPTVDPLMTQFNDMASKLGLTPAAFANVVVHVTSSSFALASALMTIESTVAASNTTTQLATAISTFTNTVAGVINTLNSSGLTVTVTAPPAISIVGVNA